MTKETLANCRKLVTTIIHSSNLLRSENGHVRLVQLSQSQCIILSVSTCNNWATWQLCNCCNHVIRVCTVDIVKGHWGTWGIYPNHNGIFSLVEVPIVQRGTCNSWRFIVHHMAIVPICNKGLVEPGVTGRLMNALLCMVCYSSQRSFIGPCSNCPIHSTSF